MFPATPIPNTAGRAVGDDRRGGDHPLLVVLGPRRGRRRLVAQLAEDVEQVLRRLGRARALLFRGHGLRRLLRLRLLRLRRPLLRRAGRRHGQGRHEDVRGPMGEVRVRPLRSPGPSSVTAQD